MPKLNTTPPLTPPLATKDSQTPGAGKTVESFLVGTAPDVQSWLGVDAEVDGTRFTGPTANSQYSLPGIPEVFPIDALSKIEGKGVSGSTFMLDATSVRGLKLQIRRVKDGGQAGFEIVFQLTEGKINGMLERINEKAATKGRVIFRGATVDAQGIAVYNSKSATLTRGSKTPPEFDPNAAAWTLGFEDPKGAKLEVVHGRAALSVRGLVRIHLRGDDKACTEQLKSVTQSLGLHQLFAPPTPKSKQIHQMMRVLWQVDHAAAQSFSAGDLEKLKVEKLESALAAKGYDAAKVAKLSYQEVFPGHFTIVDPGQMDAMVDAGARYLYSTVQIPEHVLSILENGQKSSFQRYKEGLIIEGMSTNDDLASGGGGGVFTRLVTQKMLDKQEQWVGRTYKLVQSHSQLARTDFYGWNDDMFGQRWNLDTETNFGVGLVHKIDAVGGYRNYNELIFAAGNRRENIERVVATNESDRTNLITLLKDNGYQPHNGLSVDEFVVMSPKLLAFGPLSEKEPKTGL